MWTLTIRTPSGEPREYKLQAGSNILGRAPAVDVFVEDISASRHHAEILYIPDSNIARLTDLNSTNGTYLNGRLLETTSSLNPGDQIRIGGCLIVCDLAKNRTQLFEDSRAGTRPLTRDVVIESFDSHAALLYEIAGEFNTILDLDVALAKSAELLKQFMGAEECFVILENQFERLHDLGFPLSIAREAIQQNKAINIPDIMQENDPVIRNSASLLRIRSALCVPILAGETAYGLICLYKTQPDTRPFSQQDVKLGIAISHMAALTIQRVRLIDRVKGEQKFRNLLQRFLAPSEVNYLLEDYFQTGYLPGLVRKEVTVLFVDILDSTGLAEQLGVQQFGALLSIFYQKITEIVFKHGGLVNNYMGDGIMATFGMIYGESDAAQKAIDASLEMMQAVRSTEFPLSRPLQIGIGVNSGPVMAGYIVTHERIELVVLGDTVNVASRLSELSKPNRLFISGSTKTGVSDAYPLHLIGDIGIRGRAELVSVYQVIKPVQRQAASPDTNPLESTPAIE